MCQVLLHQLALLCPEILFLPLLQWEKERLSLILYLVPSSGVSMHLVAQTQPEVQNCHKYWALMQHQAL